MIRKDGCAWVRVSGTDIRLVNPGSVARSVFFHIDLEFAARALQLVFFPPFLEIEIVAGPGCCAPGAKLRLHVDEPENHAAQMSEIAHCAALLEREDERNPAEDHHHVLGFDREQKGDQDLLFREKHSIREQQPINRAGGSNYLLVRIAERQVREYDTHARADAAQKIVLKKALRSPRLFDGRAEHPEREHVEKDVAGATETVQEKVSDQLPYRAVDHLRRHEFQKPEDFVAAHERAEEIDEIDADICNQQPLDAAWERPIEEGSATPVPGVVTHWNAANLRVGYQTLYLRSTPV